MKISWKRLTVATGTLVVLSGLLSGCLGSTEEETSSEETQGDGTQEVVTAKELTVKVKGVAEAELDETSPAASADGLVIKWELDTEVFTAEDVTSWDVYVGTAQNVGDYWIVAGMDPDVMQVTYGEVPESGTEEVKVTDLEPGTYYVRVNAWSGATPIGKADMMFEVK